MAQKDYIEGWLGIDKYVEIYRDNYTCRRRFKCREEENEAEAYFNYLQSLDNQEISIKKQEEIAAQLKRQNDLTEQQLKVQERINNQTTQRPFFPPIDPEYMEWKRMKAQELAKQHAEEERRRLEEEKKQKLLEEQEKEQTLCLAQKIDKGIASIDDNIITICHKIIEKNLYIFSNESVVLRIAETVPSRAGLSAFVEHYSNVPGIFSRIINNPTFENADEDTLIRVIEANIDDKEFICKVFSRGGFWLWCKPWHLLDATTLKLLISKNLVPSDKLEYVKDEIFWLENKDRIRTGNIIDEKDLKFAEQHWWEINDWLFQLALAKKSSNKHILDHVRINAIQLEKSQTIQIYQLLLRNPAYEYKNNLTFFLIKNLETEASLREIKPFCINISPDFHMWLDRMQQLGFIGKRGRKREVRIRYRESRKQSSLEHAWNLLLDILDQFGCLIIIIAIISAIIFFIYFY